MTRPDIACAVRAAARFWKNLGLVHYENIVMGACITCSTRMSRRSRTVIWAVDSAWRRPRTWSFETYLDNRRSASGAVMILAKGAVSWLSKMQAVTASSTSMTWYVALSKGVQKVLFLRQAHDIMAPPIRILHDSRRTKHIHVRHDLGRDTCNAGKFGVVYVRTEDQQHANLFTKPLDIQTFRKHANADHYIAGTFNMPTSYQ